MNSTDYYFFFKKNQYNVVFETTIPAQTKSVDQHINMAFKYSIHSLEKS